jgi:hypothetical protein
MARLRGADRKQLVTQVAPTPFTLRVKMQEITMQTTPQRKFHRSEAFPEDVADLVAPAPRAVARPAQPMRWMVMGLVPLGLATAAAAVGVAVTLISRVF